MKTFETTNWARPEEAREIYEAMLPKAQALTALLIRGKTAEELAVAMTQMRTNVVVS